MSLYYRLHETIYIMVGWRGSRSIFQKCLAKLKYLHKYLNSVIITFRFKKFKSLKIFAVGALCLLRMSDDEVDHELLAFMRANMNGNGSILPSEKNIGVLESAEQIYDVSHSVSKLMVSKLWTYQ
jgi:hypothetical protein